MERMNQLPDSESSNFTYRGLNKAGAVAALIAAVLFRRNLDAEWWLLRGTGIVQIGPAAAPTTVVEWFTLLQNHGLLGLTLLNLFDLVNYILVGLIFLALLFALRRTNRSWLIIATALSLVGITVYLSSNQALTMLALSKQYMAAATETQQAVLLATGQAVFAIHQNASYAGSGIYLSFLLVSVAGLILSILMLRSSIFSKRTASMGIAANGFGLSYYAALAFAPGLVFLPLSISAIFLLIWYLLVSRRLWTLGSN